MRDGLSEIAFEEDEPMEGCLDCPHPDYCAGMEECEIGRRKLRETYDEKHARWARILKEHGA